MRRGGFPIGVLSVLLVTSACSGTDDTIDAASTTIGVVVPPVNGRSSEGLIDALAMAGIRIVDEPGAASPGGALQLWSFQVENMAREIDQGGGYVGAQLDALAGSPGGLPFSYLVAGWLSSAPTPTANAAVGLMGDQPWDQAPSLVYPTAVLTLFVADAVQAGTPEGSEAAIDGILASFTGAGVCSTLSNWVNETLAFIFDSLKVNAEGEGFSGWLGTIWNAAVDLAGGAVTGLIETLTAPVVAVITDALAVIATLGMIASLLRPWALDVSVSHPETRFAVGGEPDILEEFEASVDTGIDIDWPAALVDCASVAGLDLPDPGSAEGSEVTWTVSGLPALGAVSDQGSTIDEDKRSRLHWVTSREQSSEGTVEIGTVSVAVTVKSRQVEELRAMLETLISGQLPVAPFGDIVGELFSQLTAPIFEELAELAQVNGTASVQVVHHEENEDEPTVTTATSSTFDQCLVGIWVSDEWVLPGPAGLTGSGGSGAVVSIEGNGSVSWNFDSMEPIVIIDTQVGATTELHTTGSATGQASALNGSWEVTADTTGMTGVTVHSILGEFPVEGGPGLFVGMLDGLYSCAGASISFSAPHPVEPVDVVVTLHRP
jgi:hypothetical protein